MLRVKQGSVYSHTLLRLNPKACPVLMLLREDPLPPATSALLHTYIPIIVHHDDDECVQVADEKLLKCPKACELSERT
jgi:hypothetical protein